MTTHQNFSRLLACVLCTGVLYLPGGLAQAQTAAPAGAAAATATTLPQVDAEVRKVDLSAGKITLKHGEIPNLDMPPMTMVFVARDPARLGGFKVGDKVRFRADQVKGAYVLVDIEAAP